MSNKIDTLEIKFSVGNTDFAVMLTKTEKEPNDMVYVSPASSLHYHINNEIFLAEDNPLTLHTDKNDLNYKKCIIVVPAFMYHYATSDSGVGFSAFLFSYKKNENHGKEVNTFDYFNETFSSLNELAYTDNIVYLMKRIGDEFSSNQVLFYEKIKCLLKMIFIEVYQSSAIRENHFFVSESYSVMIEDIIFNNVKSEDFNLSFLANELHLSTKQTSRLVKKFYGKNLPQVLNERRVKIATYYLTHSDKSVAEISEEVGIYNTSYFYHIFKEAHGCTPLEYRKKVKND